MNSHITAEFRRDFAGLPEAVKKQAREAFKTFMSNPQHPGLRFKKLPPHADIWSVRISTDYRAVGRRSGDTIVWFFIGSHADYDTLLQRL